MKNYSSMLLLAVSCFGMMSCISESDNESISLEFQRPNSDRQILALYDDSELRVDIRVNYASQPQTFYFGTNVSQRPVVVDGVLPGERNFIHLNWSEIIHGHYVELSEQKQHFVADGYTLISATHVHTQYDYDGDGTSNFDERSAGTCVWSSTESCVNQGQLDIPTDNALLNGDFSSGDNYWFSRWDEPQVSGEYCANSPVRAEFYWEAYLGYSQRIFIDANTRYTIVFDVRGQSDSEATVSMRVTDPSFTFFTESFDVTTTYQTKSISFENADDSYSDAHFGFNFGNGIDNRYCFDNIKLIREAP